MKRLASQLSFVFAAIAAPAAALAGSDILKCVDGSGHVTFTDQPCESGARATRLAGGAAPERSPERSPEPSAAGPEVPAVSVQRHEAPPALAGQHTWRPRVANRDRPLARDVATLKAARAQLMLIDAERPSRPTLAGM